LTPWFEKSWVPLVSKMLIMKFPVPPEFEQS